MSAKMSNAELATSILDHVGGTDNVSFVTNCATRLRFTVKDKGLVDTEGTEKLPGVIGCQWSGSQFQVVIGLGVGDIYTEVAKLFPTGSSAIEGGNGFAIEAAEDDKPKSKGLDAFVALVVSIFQPLLPALAGSGMIRGLAILAVNLGWLSSKSMTYEMLYMMTNAIFYFLPLAVAFTTAKRFDTSPIMALVIVGTLLLPDFSALVKGNGGNTISVFGLPITMFSYSSSVLAPIFATWVLSKFDHWCRKHLPHSLDLSVTPMITIFVMALLTAGIIGPISQYISILLANFVNWLTGINSVVTGAVVGGIWNILIMFGVHWAPNTIVVIPQIAAEGKSQLIAYEANANLGMAGAAFAIFLKSRNSELKTFSLSAMFSVFLSGIVEPCIYGLGVKYHNPLVAGCIGAACGGAFMGIFQTVGYSFAFGGLTTIPAFAGPTLWAYVVGLAISFFVGMILTFVFGIKDPEAEFGHAK